MATGYDQTTGDSFDTDTGEIHTMPSSKRHRTAEQVMQALSNKSAVYWAEMRQNIALARRADVLDERSIDSLLTELGDILDSGILNYPQTLQELGMKPEMTFRERKQCLGISDEGVLMEDDERRFIEHMAQKSHRTRKANWSWRIAQEAEEKQKLGWYPFFVTLTVDPLMANPRELWKEGKAFRKYIRVLAEVVANELGEPPPRKPPYRSESEYVTYCGVIEHGKSRLHDHGHFVIWLRAIPPHWRQCPNRGIRDPEKRSNNECIPMRSLWPWSLPGLSPALYFRTVGDIWSRKHNFVLPFDEKKRQPMKISVPRTAGVYITKYLSKEHKEWHHRMKATRNLGMKKLKWAISKLRDSQVEALTWRASSSDLNHTLLTIHSAPIGLVRLAAKQQEYLNKYRQRRLDLTTLLRSNSDMFMKMLSSVRSGARPDRMPSSQFFDWVGKFLPAPKGYCERRLIQAHKELEDIFPHQVMRVQHQPLGGNEIEHP